MGVEFFGSYDNLRWVYTPETVSNSHVDFIKNASKINKERDGYVSKARELRLEAKVPQAVLYNYCMSKGIPPHMHTNYMQTPKNYKAFLEEFPVFKMVDKL